ncbi:FAD-dependent oxidoreductase [Scandinavium lactucae]|uniref:Protein FixC n=1 Tax=Scandinavium lactucae TaxID=3095028 RepID=A0ABU4QWU6_9ENTR|nr:MULTISPECIES: FAD-dependent oxidoreductase [unclassified Scandinavium]MDX6041730.1 FAD-dependent oxidoreductase [Scandinavium sp. V105_6]MDX6051357.1 FAD-dependent oxidoreductase [Scandinavium sp. V105_1]
MADDFDLIIIGAGIAGSTCALLSARAGLSVLCIERGEQPGSKNLSGGRLYGYALADILPDFHSHAPLERRITHEHVSLLTADGGTTLCGQQPASASWSVLRARFDPWLAAQAEAAGAQLLCGVMVEALFQENGRIAGVLCEGERLRAKVVVLAEGANSLLAEQHGLIARPSMQTMALGIKETLSLDKTLLQERFHLEDDGGAAWLFSGQICGTKPAGAFLYTNQQSLSLGIVAPLASLRDGPGAASSLLAKLKMHPTLRPLVRGAETLEYAAHLVPEGGLNSVPLQRAGNGWLLVGDTLRTCINTGMTIRGMDTAMLSAQAATQALVAHCQQPAQPLQTLYDRALQRHALWQQLQRYREVPALLRSESPYRQWPEFSHAVWRDLTRVEANVNLPLWRSLLRHSRRFGPARLARDILRSLRCL